MSQMACVFCCSKVDKLILEYSGYSVLAHCVKCDRIADPYLEYDLVLLSLDLILQKPEAYRHMMWTKLSNSFISRFFILIVMFEVYINLLLVEHKGILLNQVWQFTLVEKFVFYILLSIYYRHRYSKIVAVPLCISSFPILFILASILWQFNISTDYMFVYALKMLRLLSQVQAVRLFVNGPYYESAIVIALSLFIKYHVCQILFPMNPMLML